MKIAVHTLGCKVNQYESQALEAEIVRRGHTLGSFDQPCDAYIINTCSVTATGDKKSRQAVRRARRENPEAAVAVCGCWSQLNPEEARALGAELVCGTGDRRGFIDLLEKAAAEKRAIVSVDDPMTRRVFEPLGAGGLSERTRAMLKIEDGCRNFCSYCVIPYARGPVRSLPAEAALEEARSLAARGFKEVVLTGIEISSYGADLENGPDIAALTSALCRGVPELRFRLGSLEPRTVTEDFCRALEGLPNLCGQFHLSLQSGCDATLRRMNRKYDGARYLRSVELLRERFPGCAVTTDLIVGFPGETEEEFAETMDFIRRCAFSAMHIFPYSPRPGTPAAAMAGQVKNSVKEIRAADAAALASQMEQRYLQSLEGSELRVLFEHEEGGLFWGHAGNYALVGARGEALRNEEKTVKITGVEKDRLTGVLIT